MQPGRNCWRVEHAGRLAWLIDGAAYFSALKRAILAAREQVFIVGWDFDSRILLERREPMDGVPDRLRDLLVYIAERRPSLVVRVLIWDYTIFYAAAREPLPTLTFAWSTPDNVKLELDETEVLGASHHAKFVVIDDKVAFVGGMDVAEGKWDTPEHRPDDPGRTDQSGTAYEPYHDVQAAVDGDAAAAIGELARARWYAATGRRVRPPARDDGADPWPETLAPDLREARVALARTVPRTPADAGIREVETLYLDSIAAARDLIFVENQYFTANAMTDALAARLGEPDGPEVVMVLPLHCHGWLEELTMDTLRVRALHRLEAADRYGRLRVCTPILAEAPQVNCHVHAKLMTVDDRLARVGSANLNNRSMSFDTELDIAIEADGPGPCAGAVAALRNRILAEHLGTSPEKVAGEHAARGSLIAAIDALGDADGRRLDLLCPGPESAEPMLGIAALADAEGPVDLSKLELGIVSDDARSGRRHRHIWFAVLAVGLFVALAASWRYMPWSELASPEVLGEWFGIVRADALAPAYVIGGYILLGLVGFPVTVLIAATAAAFGPFLGFGYALAGALASAAAGFGVGIAGGRPLVRRFARRRVHAVNRLLRERGVLAVALIRLVPVAPFTVVNLVLGSSRVRFVEYLFGTVLGLLPGIAMLSALGGQVEDLVRDPTWADAAVALGVLLAWLALGFVVQRLMVRPRARRYDRDAAAA